jgi:hypothetical protein
MTGAILIPVACCSAFSTPFLGLEECESKNLAADIDIGMEVQLDEDLEEG